MFKRREMVLLIIVIAISVIIGTNNPAFFSWENIVDLLKSNAVLGIIAFGMLIVIITGGIDVSVAAVLAAVTWAVGNWTLQFGGNVFVAFLVGAFTGTLLGLLNGFFIVKFKIPPIVVTLGTMSIINGFILYQTKGTWISNLPKEFIDFGRVSIFNFGGKETGIPVQVLFLLVAAGLTFLILRYTLLGRGIYAVGGNPGSGERIGFRLNRIYLFSYAYVGLLAGIAGTLHTATMRQVDPIAFTGFELQVIATVVIGGANILGGSGTVMGCLLGVLFLSITSNGLILMHIPTFWQKILIGSIIIMAVSVDVLQKKFEERKHIRVDVQ